MNLLTRPLHAALGLAFLWSAAGAEPAPWLAYLRNAQVWIQTTPASPATALPRSQGARLFDFARDGTLAFTNSTSGAGEWKGEVILGRPPYVNSQRLSQGGSELTGHRSVRWLFFQGSSLLAGTDQGTVGWNFRTGRSLKPGEVPALSSISADGAVTVTGGSFTPSGEPGITVSGPDGRPGREVFSFRRPQPLLWALKRAASSLHVFQKMLDPHARLDVANWSVSPPEVTQDGGEVYFASNVGLGLGAYGDTQSLIFQVRVRNLKVQVLDWLRALKGQVSSVLPSPDGRRLLILGLQHRNDGQPASVLWMADLHARTVREVVQSTAPAGQVATLDSVCWLADSRQVTLSVAYSAPGQGKMPLPEPSASAFTLYVRDVIAGRVTERVPGATSLSCGHT